MKKVNQLKENIASKGEVYLNTKKYRNNKSMELSSVVRSVMQNVKNKLYTNKEILYKLEDSWKQIVGADYFDYSMPSDIKSYKEATAKGVVEIRVLCIKCFNSNAASKVTYRIDAILRNIKDLFGYKAFSKIEIETSYNDKLTTGYKNIYYPIKLKKPSEDILEQIREIKDDGIREGLVNLANCKRNDTKFHF